MLTVNPAADAIKPSATLAINQQVNELRAQGHTVYHWGFGQSAFPVPLPIVEALQANAHQKAYLPGLGLPELREAIAHYYHQEFQYDVDASQVIIGPGSKELIFDLLYLIEGELLLPAPSWVSYEPQAKLLNKPCRWVATQADNNYLLTADELEQACQQSEHDTKLLILNSPNNPTGCMHSSAQLRELVEVCRRHCVIVISDEIYAKVEFGDQSHDSLVNYYPEGTFVTAGLSKLFGAGGYRLGLCLMPKALQEKLVRPWSALISETFICVSSPIQYAAITAYQHFDRIRPALNDYCAIQAAACRYIYQCLQQLNIQCNQPVGAFYLLANFCNQRDTLNAQGVYTSEQLSHWLLDTVRIATLPGSEFGLPPESLCLRLAAVDFDGNQALETYQQQRDIHPNELVERAMPHIAEACTQLSKQFEHSGCAEYSPLL